MIEKCNVINLFIYYFIILFYLFFVCLQWADRLLGFHQSFIFLSPLKFSFNSDISNR